MKQYSVKQYSMKQYIYIYTYPRTAQRHEHERSVHTTRINHRPATPQNHCSRERGRGMAASTSSGRQLSSYMLAESKGVAVQCCYGPHVGSGGGGACHLAMLLTFRRRHHERGRAFHRTYPTCRTRWTTRSCRPLAGHCAQSRPRAAPGTCLLELEPSRRRRR